MITLFRNILRLLWRIWFYLLFTGVIVIGAPVLLIVTAKESWYPVFFKVAKVWAKLILIGMGFKVKKEILQKIPKDKSFMFVANHTSMIDIMLMLVVVKNPFVFVGKAELAKIPVFGFFYKRTCILVDRGDFRSRQKVFKEAQRRLATGLSICIFPEGLVPEDESIVLEEFKGGAFKLALAHKIPIIPLSFYDCKKRFSYTFFSGSPGFLRVKIHPQIETENLDKNAFSQLRDSTHELLYKDLVLHQKN
ncbi:lysophospholipid acyltransferase family protein [Flavicella sediminum]|uniref:lysophospholipid acyltransferase family protein n=1 Tax=Flavicella sediminum TaxID=2585141 RepID=UPI00140A3023|nr:lysophospholipid acyltransferase family protein [Flavicella sediminum]